MNTEKINKKIIVLFLFLTLFTWGHSSAQGDSVEIQIKEIKIECDRINNESKNLKVVKEDKKGQTSEGGILEKLYDNNTLQKAILTFFGETGKSAEEYYFKHGEIIFLLQRETRYKQAIYMGKTEIQSREENRFYFKNQKLIQWIGNDGKIVDAALYPDKEKEILDDFKNIH